MADLSLLQFVGEHRCGISVAQIPQKAAVFFFTFFGQSFNFDIFFKAIEGGIGSKVDYTLASTPFSRCSLPLPHYITRPRRLQGSRRKSADLA